MNEAQDLYAEQIKGEIKSEAYKEFAEKVKQGFFSNSEQDVLICGVVDNILKEMAGEN